MSQTAPATEATVLTFTKKKETPGTFVYSEDERPGQPPIIGSLYVKRFFAAGREKVTVTIS